MSQVLEHLYYRSDWDRDLPQDWDLGKLWLSQVLPVSWIQDLPLVPWSFSGIPCFPVWLLMEWLEPRDVINPYPTPILRFQVYGVGEMRWE